MTKRRLNGATVRAIRSALGIAQQDLALRVDIHPAYLSNIEAGIKQPSFVVQRKLADELGVTLDAITHVETEQVAS